MVLNQKILNFHWNVKGEHFFELHEETEKLYNVIQELIDKVAEKTVMKNTPALGSFIEALELSKIKETTSEFRNQEQIAEILTKDLQIAFEVATQTHIDNMITLQPLLDEIYTELEKAIWQFSMLIKK